MVLDLHQKRLMNLVADHVKTNRIKADEFADGKSGDKWFKNFMKRDRLSKKKAEMISTAPGALNPFLTNWKRIFKNTRNQVKTNFITTIKVCFQQTKPGVMSVLWGNQHCSYHLV